MALQKLRAVAIKLAGKDLYHIEKKNIFGQWVEFKVLGVTPRFDTEDKAVEYVSQWEGSNSKKVVQEFNFNG